MKCTNCKKEIVKGIETRVGHFCSDDCVEEYIEQEFQFVAGAEFRCEQCGATLTNDYYVGEDEHGDEVCFCDEDCLKKWIANE